MKTRGFVQFFLGVLAMCLTLWLGASAQSMPTSKTKKPNAGNNQMMSGSGTAKMGRTTKEQRLAAAARHANRRADHVRKHRVGVK